ncbi:uncharacterized protein LOC126647788 [Myiozetetes cayanensis]|uniref:uncharacterized protein LOC126647788 n=1 Tax=Myiozetetes cayanensis TaxID=478635 RepID=UPI00215F3010|nr:uncharacterized protein LOC126647788 [Myiozetetes cayanensis]
MLGAGATLLCCLLVAVGGLRVPVLWGLQGQSLSFPALSPVFEDIARVTWRTRGTHIAEAKPREKKFSVDYLPAFHGRLFIHPANLSLEIGQLRPEDSGNYEVVVDTLSDPTSPKTFQYFLRVYGEPSEPGNAAGHGGSTATPPGVTEPRPGDPTTPGTGGGQPPGGREGLGTCGGWRHYCVLKGYLVAAVLGPLLVLLVIVHLVTRDKVSAGDESPRAAIPQGWSPWQR